MLLMLNMKHTSQVSDMCPGRTDVCVLYNQQVRATTSQQEAHRQEAGDGIRLA